MNVGWTFLLTQAGKCTVTLTSPVLNQLLLTPLRYFRPCYRSAWSMNQIILAPKRDRNQQPATSSLSGCSLTLLLVRIKLWFWIETVWVRIFQIGPVQTESLRGVSQCCEADSLCEETSVVSTQSCPASKVASSCPCCCHSNRKKRPGWWRILLTFFFSCCYIYSHDALQRASSESAEVTQLSGQ